MFGPLLNYSFGRALELVAGPPLLLEQLAVAQDRLLGDGREVAGRIKVLEREVDHLLGLHPLAVDVVEAFQMNNLKGYKQIKNAT